MNNTPNQSFLSGTSDKIIEWIDTLPDIETIYDNNIHVNGILVHHDAEYVRIVVDNIVLSVAMDDVIDIHEIEFNDMKIKYGIPVELIIKVSSKILEIGSASIYNDIIFHERKPFALSCRPEFSFIKSSSVYKKLEREFFELNGIETPRHDSHNI